ncbi:MAG TPA: hypothetical protein VK171_16060, partial [Fimbriimonas sp.]|nr:hypothetical protein [Fimbriimonas sp.]
DPQFELEYVAKDADGASIALSPGSANWTLLSGNSSMSVTRDGLATPLLPGDVSIKVSVDGVSSPAITISLSKAEITAKYLGPEWSSALVLGGDGFVQGGSLNDLPCLWRGTNESHVNLKPADAISGKVLATNSDVQVGHIYIASSIHERGGLWTGSAASFVDLTPVSPRFALGSNATCAANGRQGGYAIFSHPLTQLIIFPEPGYWSGTASSWTNLLPSGFVLGAVFGISASNECGEVRDDSGNGKKAALWSGTAASFKSLHPSSASESVAYGLNADYQVGSATFGSNPRAYAWRGTPGSAIDLHGSLGRSSEARVVVDQFAAGHVDSIGTIWNIPSRRALKLDSVLPSGFSQSEIYGGAKTSTGYDFVGYVSNPNSGVSLGVVWHVPFRRMPQ